MKIQQSTKRLLWNEKIIKKKEKIFVFVDDFVAGQAQAFVVFQGHVLLGDLEHTKVSLRHDKRALVQKLCPLIGVERNKPQETRAHQVYEVPRNTLPHI